MSKDDKSALDKAAQAYLDNSVVGVLAQGVAKGVQEARKNVQEFVDSGKAQEAAKKTLEMAVGSIAYPTVYATQYVVSTINENLEAGKARNDKLVADCSKDHSLTEILTTAPLPSVCSAVKDVVAKRGK